MANEVADLLDRALQHSNLLDDIRQSLIEAPNNPLVHLDSAKIRRALAEAAYLLIELYDELLDPLLNRAQRHVRVLFDIRKAVIDPAYERKVVADTTQIFNAITDAEMLLDELYDKLEDLHGDED